VFYWDDFVEILWSLTFSSSLELNSSTEYLWSRLWSINPDGIEVVIWLTLQLILWYTEKILLRRDVSHWRAPIIIYEWRDNLSPISFRCIYCKQRSVSSADCGVHRLRYTRFWLAVSVDGSKSILEGKRHRSPQRWPPCTPVNS